MNLTSRHRRRSNPVTSPLAGLTAIVAVTLFFFSIVRSEERVERADEAAGVVLDDLEPIVVDVGPSGPEGPFRLAGRSFPTTDALLPVLRKLAQPGESASVRLHDDARYEDAAKALRTCERAGFAAVALLTDGPRD
jgi:biopolymer transport protein ExbD